ncbi:VOC family protein [Engelhardtia mirabilis]|uniref:27 kDa antigen Cfp30B n=1 Tax=Engelhardtia mirabilis TaxID=2528011 RepID=A0A518BHJ8_9BACT|nr:27 kDa antigen Cfp30B [Planctomycetes bacterium Pla133]QDV00783.1 27 kDa antigen Cfp30B [Planctomycetes bacterium Pla86]
MSHSDDHGRIIHHDLKTTDVGRSIAFFEALLGWKAVEVTPGGPESTHFQMRVGDRIACALMGLDADLGVPSHFVPYIACDDVDAVCARFASAGGEVRIGPMDLGEHGRWAVCSDLGEGLVSLWKGTDPPAPRDETAMPFGLFCWDELLSTDAARDAEFYAGVFDYDVKTMPTPDGDYLVLERGGLMHAGVMQKPAEAPGPSTWLSYARVEDVDAMTEKARSLSAQVWVDPRDIPNIGRFAVMADPTGALFALFREASTAS